MSRIAAIVLTFAAAVCLGASGPPEDLVKKGNTCYEQGDYEGALAAFKAARQQIESAGHQDGLAAVCFDEGAAHYQLGQFEEAALAFSQASALASSPEAADDAIQARAEYNLGNCAFRSAQAMLQGDLEGALSQLDASVEHYRNARRLVRERGTEELAPYAERAAHNIEVARLAMKALRDEMQRRQQQQQEQQQQREEARRKLDELIQEQQQNTERTKQTREQRQQDPEPQPRQQQMEEDEQLARQQEQTREKTQALSDQLDQQTPGPSKEEVKQHLDQSTEKQAAARKKLREGELDQAGDEQQAALDELEKARKALEDDRNQQNRDGGKKQDTQDGEQQQDGQNQPESSQEQQENQQNQQPPSQNQQSPGQRQGEQDMEAAPLDETARDILEEEQRNREKRRVIVQGGYQPVEKDW